MIHVVLAPFSSKVTKKAKQEAWETIPTQLNCVGANIDSAKTLRDVLWANIRCSTLKKVIESKKTGSGGSGELTELDQTVLDIFLFKTKTNFKRGKSTIVCCKPRIPIIYTLIQQIIKLSLCPTIL